MAEAMKLTRTLSLAVALGVIILASQVDAAKQSSKRIKSADIALTAKGTLIGQVVNRNNVPQANAVVEIVNRKGEIKRFRADKKGRFEAKLAQSGSYAIRTPSGAIPLRVWSKALAPKNAKTGVLLIHDSKVVRGQLELVETIQANWLPISALTAFGTVVGFEAIKKGS